MNATQKTGDKKMTAMILKMIARDEFGTDKDGYVAETFDRVEVVRVKKRSINLGGDIAHCVTDGGEKFYAFLAFGEAKLEE